MLAVSNTSPISNLAAIGHLELLKSQCSVVWIPGAVNEELAAHPDPVARDVVQYALQSGWLQMRIPSDSHLLRLLRFQLHKGEAEAIALAAELHADVILMDEQEGRQRAAEAGIAVTGVLGILLRAKSLGQINAIRPAVDLLRSKAGFFISTSLASRVLAAAESDSDLGTRHDRVS